MMSKKSSGRALDLKGPLVGLLAFSVYLLISLTAVTAQEIKWIKVGSLHTWFRADGCEPEVGRTGLQSDQQDGMRWPAQYRLQDNVAAKALWIGTTNYKDFLSGSTFDHKVVHVGPRGWDLVNEFIPMEFKQITRFELPRIIVDDEEVSETTAIYADQINGVEASQKPDRIIFNTVRTSIGVEMKRTIMAFSQQYHNNYFIYDYVFTNTGNVDKDDDIELPNQVLTGVYFFFMYRYAVSREGADWTINSSRWGINEMLSTRGEDPTAGDPFRAQLAWFGRHSAVPYDCIGAPDQKSTGRLGAPQYIGVVTLYADKSPAEKVDDPFQPTTTTYQQSDDPPTQPNDQFNAARMTSEYAWISKGHRLPRHDQVVGTGFPNQLESTPGGFMNCNGFGPYTLRPGESIHLVMAEGVNGLNRQLCEEIGRKWLKEITPYTLPNGTTTTNKDEYKNAWVATGQDSLFQTFNRAIANYKLNYAIPQPPPPPETFEVKSSGNSINLFWAKNAESWPGFAGYRLYRAIHKPDTTFQEIFACGLGTNNPAIVNSYEDKTPERGKDYYYYVVSFDDGKSNNSSANPRGSLQSSQFYTKTAKAANLKRPAGNALSDIRVVPNPYNIRARELQFGVGQPDRIAFWDIPPVCTIKIFTERGDLVQTLEHTNGTGDENWDSRTSAGQLVVSGIYIAVFETPAGERAMRKFVVIR